MATLVSVKTEFPKALPAWVIFRGFVANIVRAIL